MDLLAHIILSAFDNSVGSKLFSLEPQGRILVEIVGGGGQKFRGGAAV